jgi:hypothetical protein
MPRFDTSNSRIHSSKKNKTTSCAGEIGNEKIKKEKVEWGRRNPDAGESPCA